MRIEIEIPKEFEEHFMQDKFKDSFERIMADIEHSLENGDCLCAGRYEFETIEMLQKAFENSRQAYDIGKVIKELDSLRITGNSLKFDLIPYNEAIEIVKQGGVADNCCEWKDNGLYGYSTSCTEFRSKIAYKDTFFEYCPYCGKKIKVVE